MVGFGPTFHFIIHKIFVLSLSNLGMKSNELFANAELFKKFRYKSSNKRPGSPVIDKSLSELSMFYFIENNICLLS